MNFISDRRVTQRVLWTRHNGDESKTFDARLTEQYTKRKYINNLYNRSAEYLYNYNGSYVPLLHKMAPDIVT